MVRVKRGNVARNRRNKILKIAKGFRGTHSKLFRMANQQVMKALRYSYVEKKKKKRVSELVDRPNQCFCSRRWIKL